MRRRALITLGHNSCQSGDKKKRSLDAWASLELMLKNCNKTLFFIILKKKWFCIDEITIWKICHTHPSIFQRYIQPINQSVHQSIFHLPYQSSVIEPPQHFQSCAYSDVSVLVPGGPGLSQSHGPHPAADVRQVPVHSQTAPLHDHLVWKQIESGI